ncbi:MAG TPA: hypothetical protein VIR81_08975, partial [Myxococcales bacterium]
PEPSASLLERHEETVAAPLPGRVRRARAAADVPAERPASLHPLDEADAPGSPSGPIAPPAVHQGSVPAEAPRQDEHAPAAGRSREAAALEERIRRAVAAAMDAQEPPRAAAPSPLPALRESDRRESVIEREVRTVEVHPDGTMTGQPSPRQPGVALAAPSPLPQRREPAAPRRAPAPAEPGPTVQVTIGRVEVRAVPPAAPSPAPVRRTGPAISLEDYLHRRDRGPR